jgi:hypothetical protein
MRERHSTFYRILREIILQLGIFRDLDNFEVSKICDFVWPNFGTTLVRVRQAVQSSSSLVPKIEYWRKIRHRRHHSQ